MKKLISIFAILLIQTAVGFAQENGGSVPTPEQYRDGIAQSILSLKVEKEPVSEIKDVFIPGDIDSIPLRIYYPGGQGPFPVIYHIHGGCWVAGDLETHDNICRFLANSASSIVIAIDYRQPPEERFPAAFDDCYAALKWIYNNAENIGGDKSRIAILGDSSGGNLVSAVCLKNRDEGNPVPILIHVLVNPALDLREDSSSYNAYMGCVNAYLNNMEDSKEIMASPLAASSFKNLPKALVIVTEKDEIKDEGLLYHNLLLRDGVESVFYEIPEIGHLSGFWAAGSKEADGAKDLVIKELVNNFR